MKMVSAAKFKRAVRKITDAQTYSDGMEAMLQNTLQRLEPDFTSDLMIENGSKKVLLKNVNEAKFNKLLEPIAEKVLAEDQLPDVNFSAFFRFLFIDGPTFISVFYKIHCRCYEKAP